MIKFKLSANPIDKLFWELNEEFETHKYNLRGGRHPG
ncbi:hypothetical protein Mucpa_3862 [Mucilaginibacter paludis DSM 18603]|uniref:Uncharacterized protein n=1 Tax=Mucilaginibacter paludis DSM 18603 TaxID=714943 RepID=H1Y046_9SPHI|nr:hypothetical protein Mucpa_3862 [Mucilaginibacter paludis DSM 18603]